MNTDLGDGIDLSTTAQEILLAASSHDVETLTGLLKSGSANVRDEDTGATPLHAAISACEDDRTGEGKSTGTSQGFLETIKLLLENGAIWNDLDAANETPGCIALRLGLKDAYQLIVEAGVRAELLLNRLDDFEVLQEDDSDAGEAESATPTHEQVTEAAVDMAPVDREQNPPTLLATEPNGDTVAIDISSAKYLASELTFGGDRLLDADNNGVMMAWETDLMRRSADSIVIEAGQRVLNVGHGMGIIDAILQEKRPAEHHIIEAHPAVVDRMREGGWLEKENVVVHQGRWQDVVSTMVNDGHVFDAIYFDTFAEDYKDLREFFSEYVISLLDPEGRFGFFNGLGADRQICYDVYTKVVEMDLFEAGLDTEWQEINIGELDETGEWEGVRRKYWTLSTYRLPVCTFIG